MKRQPVTRRDPKVRKPRRPARAESVQLRLGFRNRPVIRPTVVVAFL